ncbi:MAG TPA: metal-dependent hydrolase [Vicinamibacterales bacterium]|jgi:inner membrane protein|nr:metal-dependent hydrolase [Vicinamibacterales bacterium]
MPTIFGHAIAATAAGQWWRRMPPRFWVWTVGCAMAPDADVISFAFGIRYEDMFGHRGFTHSFFFAALLGAVAAWQVADPGPRIPDPGRTPSPGRLRLFLWFAAVTASHGLLDAFTNGGRGIAFFAPFTGHRYFFPWRPIQVSPIGVGFFSPRGLRVLASESVWIWLPSAIMAASARIFRRPT